MTGTLPATTGGNNGVMRWVMEPSVLAAVNALLDELPRSEGADDLVLRILNATEAEDVNLAEGDTRKVQTLYGMSVVIETVKVLDSDKADGNLARYLRVEGYIPQWENEQFAISTGSQIAVIQLAQLYKLGKLPAVVRFSAPENWRGEGTPPTNVKYMGPAEDAEQMIFRAPGGRRTVADQIAEDKARRAAAPKPADSDKAPF